MSNKSENSRAQPDLENPPAGYFLVVPPKDSESDDAIDPGKVVRVLRVHWKLLVIMTFLGGATAAVITLQMRNGAVSVRFVPRGQEKFDFSL